MSKASRAILGLAFVLAAGDYLALPLLGLGPVADLTVGTTGGFGAYQPLPELPAYGAFIVQLQPDLD